MRKERLFFVKLGGKLFPAMDAELLIDAAESAFDRAAMCTDKNTSVTAMIEKMLCRKIMGYLQGACHFAGMSYIKIKLMEMGNVYKQFA